MHSGTEVRVNSGAKRVLAAIAAVAMVFLAGGAVAAELPPPNFMPGFPMIAGPQLMIMWQPVPGAAKYKVFINGKEAAESVAFQAFLPAPEKAGSYEIQVQAVAADGAAGKLSDKKIVKIIKLEPPKGLTGRAMENGYALRWDAAPGAMVYNVYRSLKPGADYAILASVQDTRHVDTTAAKDKKYFYTVSAKDAGGAESGRSEEVAYDAAEAAKAEIVAAAEKVKEVLFKVELVKCVRAGEFGTFQMPGHITRDRDGNFYVSDTQNRRVVVFNPDLSYKTEFPPKDAKYTLYPMNLLKADPDNRIWVGVGLTMLVLDTEGRQLNRYSFSELLAGKIESKQAVSPSSIAFGKDSIYLADSFNKRILVMTPDFKFDRAIDVSAIAGTVSSLRITAEGNLLFGDVLGATVNEVTPEGKKVKSFGEFGVVPGKFGRVDAIYKDEKGNYWIADSMTTMIHVYDKAGKYVHDFAKNDQEYFPVVSSYSFDVDPKTRTIAFVESLNHDFCVIRIPQF